MTRVLALLLAFAAVLAPAAAQSKAPPNPLLDARKKAADELTKMQAEMTKLGYKGEIDDCGAILKRVLSPDASMPMGTGTPYPGDDKFAELMKSWSELGGRLAAIYHEAEGQLTGKDKDEAELLAGWFDTFEHVARGALHLNRRRKFIKVTPIMPDWSGSIGGYLHGRYLQMNRDQPSTQGLGAHNEDAKLPGHTSEGEAAGHGILGGGTAESVMDGWLGSEYHRDPVFVPGCSRIAFGGLPGGWWSCRNAGGGAGSALGNVITWPGDGDTEIPTFFANEGPNPLAPYGITSAGTMVVIDFIKGKPRKPTIKLLDPDGKPVETLEVSKHSPYSFVAKQPLQANGKYSVEVVGADGAKFTFSFTTGGGGWGGGK